MDNKKTTFEEVLQSSGKLVYTNVGVSMMPLIREGRDILIIEKCDSSALKKYDAVLFRRNNVKGRGEYVLHRILKVLPDNKYYIVGDNCTGGETVDSSQILGILTGIVRNEKPYPLSGFRYKTYLFFRCTLYPVRFIYLRVKQCLKYTVRAVIYKLGIRR